MVKAYKDFTPEEKAKHRERTERYRKANPELYRLAAAKFYKSNPDKVAASSKKWRTENKQHMLDFQREAKRQRKLEAIQHLGGKCHKCEGVFHPAVYEFHHTDPTTKTKDPSKMLLLKWETITKELDKCQLLCANCHRLVHHTWDENATQQIS
jgi:predicted HNH restriction endonuclease